MAESLRGTGVSLQVLRPGFVRSKMTEGRAEAPFATDVDAVADDAVAGLSTDAHGALEPPAAALRLRRAVAPPPVGLAAPAGLSA